MGLSKNFSFRTVSLDLDAMFKIKSLLYKDLISNSRGCRKSNQLLRHPLRSSFWTVSLDLDAMGQLMKVQKRG